MFNSSSQSETTYLSPSAIKRIVLHPLWFIVPVGERVKDGAELGVTDGTELGIADGTELGIADGMELGIADGPAVGSEATKANNRSKTTRTAMKLFILFGDQQNKYMLFTRVVCEN